MIYFQETGGRIAAKQEKDDGAVFVIAWCDVRPESHVNWVVNPKEKMNGISRIVFAQALAVAWAAQNHAAVIRDLLNNHTEALAVKD